MATVKDQRLVFNCPKCDNVIRARPATAGLTGKCVRCGHAFTIPDKSDVVEPQTVAVEDKPRESYLYPARTPGPPRQPASSPGVAGIYHALGLVLVIIGSLIAIVSFGLVVKGEVPAVTGVAAGAMIAVTSIPLFAISTLIRDTRTAADCLRILVDRANDMRRDG